VEWPTVQEGGARIMYAGEKEVSCVPTVTLTTTIIMTSSCLRDVS